MRKFLARLSVFAILITSVAWVGVPAQAAPGDYNCDLSVGSGTSVSPYEISSRADLEELPDCDDQVSPKFFLQTVNIDLGGTPWVPISLFSGEYDGNGKTISNLEINLPASSNPVGLFGNSNRSAVVRNLTVKVKSIVGNDAVGALFGNFQGAFLENISVLPQDNTHVLTRTVTSYSVASNVVTFNIGTGHGVQVGAQLATGDSLLGPLPANTVHTVTASNSGAGTVSVRFEAANASSTNLSPSASITFTNPLVLGNDGVGGVMGRAYGYYASALNSQIHFNHAVQFHSATVRLSVAGQEAVGGIAGMVERIRFYGAQFEGTVSGISGGAEDSIGGFAGRSYEARWQDSVAVANVAGVGDRIGGLFGMVDDSSNKLYCIAGTPAAFTSARSDNANEIIFTYPAGTDHEISVNDAVALKVFGFWNTPQSIQDGSIGSVTDIDSSGGPIVIKVSVTTTTFGSENYYPTDFLMPIAPANAGCTSGVHDSGFNGLVTAGNDGNGYSSTGGVAGSFSRSFATGVVVQAHVFGGGQWVGGAFGSSQGSSLADVEILAQDSSVRGGDRVGGIAGYASGFTRNANPVPLLQVDASDLDVGAISVSGLDYVGGLFGHVAALSVRRSDSAASVEGSARVGGLFGETGYSSSIINSSYSGSWVRGGTDYIGGIAGAVQGAESAVAVTAAQRISSSVTRFTTGANHMLGVDDFVWLKFASEGISKVVRVVATPSTTQFDLDIATDGTYSVTSGDEFIEVNGTYQTHVTQSYPVGAAGSIRADGSNIGGLIGSLSDGIVEDSSNRLQLRIGLGNGVDGENIGGLVGNAYHSTSLVFYIRDSFSSANIYADGDFDDIRDVGGLIGEAGGYEISRSYFSGNLSVLNGVTGTTMTNIGGIAGSMFRSQITNSFARSTIQLPLGYKVGGLAGEQSTFGSPGVPTGVVGSFFDGTITVTGGDKVGGLVGGGNQHIAFSHVTGSVSAGSNVGGLLGEPQSNPNITNSYLDGQVARTDALTTNEVIGTTQNYTGNLTTAFWNSTAQTSQLTAGAKTATELATASTFSSWSGFADYFFMPAADLTTKPYPTLTALAQTPGALTVLNPTTDLNGILEGTQIVPIQTSVWSYPRPVLHVTGTLPAGLSSSGLTVSGTPTSAGAYSFGLAAKNTAGTGPVTNFSGTIASLTPPVAPPYDGPFVSSYSPRPAIVGKLVRLNGAKLESVNEIKIGEFAVKPTAVTADSVSFIVPKLAPGTYDFTLVSGSGSITVQQGITVVASSAKAASIRKQADGTVKIYHLAPDGVGKIQLLHNGKEIAWFDSSNPATASLRSGYLVRTRMLVSGKNVFEVLVSGERVKRVVYSR